MHRMLRDVGLRPYRIRTLQDIDTVKDNLSTLVPIIPISCVNGEGLDHLKRILFELPKRRRHQNKINKPFEFLIEDVFNVGGVGIVVSGFVNRGQWRMGEAIHIGPLKNGTSISCVPKSAHVAQTDVDRVYAGHSACFAIPIAKKQRQMLRRGMVALKEPIKAVRTFTAEVFLIKGKNMTICKNQYESTLHILHMKNVAVVIDIKKANGKNDEQVIRPGDRATITFDFPRRLAYIRKGMRLIMRDGFVRGLGVVTETQEAP
jgi:elongation factor 1-alpha